MSYTFLQERGEESSAESFSDIPQYVLSRLNLTAGKSCCNGNATESCPSFLSGTTCEHLTASLGVDSLTLCAEDSHAPTFRAPTNKAPGQTGNTPACGRKWQGSLARYDHASCLWRTPQTSFLAGLDVFSETWPRWGLMLHGECSEVTMPDCFTAGRECGLLPTPLTNPSKRTLDENGCSVSAKGERYGVSLFQLAGGQPCPQFQEWLMGWVTGWTAIEPLETDRFRLWLLAHGELSPESEANK